MDDLSHLHSRCFILQVDCPFPPSDKIGINSVQRENEEIVPMKDMKMAWVPYVPLEDRYCFIIYVEQCLLPFVIAAYILAFTHFNRTYLAHIFIALSTGLAGLSI